MTTLEAMQSALDGEHAAIYVYGALGAHTSASAEPALFELVTTLYRTHRSRRDHLRALLTERGASPAPAAATYELPQRLATPAQVRRGAIALEDRCAGLYAALVANTVAAERAWAIQALTEAASARILLGGRAQDFPGAPELG